MKTSHHASEFRMPLLTASMLRGNDAGAEVTPSPAPVNQGPLRFLQSRVTCQKTVTPTRRVASTRGPS